MSSNEIIEKLKEISKTKCIRWDIHDCSLCGTPVGYVFSDGNAFFDSMCDCSSYYHPPVYRSWEDVQRTIEMNINNDTVKNLVEMIRKAEV